MQFTTAAQALILLGFANVGVALLLLVLRLASGPMRDVLLEACPGCIKLDRSIAGDHVVSNYGPDEVRCLFVDANMLYVETRMGHSPVVQFGEREIDQAIAALLALRLWPEENVRAGEVNLGGGMKRWVILSRCHAPTAKATGIEASEEDAPL